MTWDENEQRSSNNRDHDLLIEISADVKNLIEWMKEHKKQLDKHKEEDKIEFEGHSKQLRDLSRGYWIAIGAIFIIEFLLRYFK